MKKGTRVAMRLSFANLWRLGDCYTVIHETLKDGKPAVFARDFDGKEFVFLISEVFEVDGIDWEVSDELTIEEMREKIIELMNTQPDRKMVERFRKKRIALECSLNHFKNLYREEERRRIETERDASKVYYERDRLLERVKELEAVRQINSNLQDRKCELNKNLNHVSRQVKVLTRNRDAQIRTQERMSKELELLRTTVRRIGKLIISSSQ